MAEEKKKKISWGRKRYLEDFRRAPSGEFIYTGATYAFTGTPAQRRNGLIFLWIPAAVLLAAVAVPGFLDPVWLPEHKLVVLVLLPYICTLFSAVSAVWALVRLSVNRDPIREYVYAATVEALPRRAVLTVILAAVSLLCVLIALAFGVFRTTAGALLLCVPYLAAAACALLIRRLCRGMEWKETRIPDLPDAT